jgi:hypothetical protein
VRRHRAAHPAAERPGAQTEAEPHWSWQFLPQPEPSSVQRTRLAAVRTLDCLRLEEDSGPRAARWVLGSRRWHAVRQGDWRDRPHRAPSCSSRWGLAEVTGDHRTRDRRQRPPGCPSCSSGRVRERPPPGAPTASPRRLPPLVLRHRAPVARGASRSPGSTERGLGFRTRSGNTPPAQVTARWPRSQV